MDIIFAFAGFFSNQTRQICLARRGSEAIERSTLIVGCSKRKTLLKKEG